MTSAASQRPKRIFSDCAHDPFVIAPLRLPLGVKASIKTTLPGKCLPCEREEIIMRRGQIWANYDAAWKRGIAIAEKEEASIDRFMADTPGSTFDKDVEPMEKNIKKEISGLVDMGVQYMKELRKVKTDHIERWGLQPEDSNDELKTFLMSHDEHSISEIPRRLREHLRI